MNTIEHLKSQFGANKDVPRRYETEIYTVLSHYPELKNTRINFSLAVSAQVPYGTKPSFKSCFVPKKNRVYTITILEHAAYPESEALFKKLTPGMRLGVLAHELAHVKQYESCGPLSLFKMLSSFLILETRRRIERGADKTAIKHGFGEGLLAHALYIRSIPGYVQQRPKLDTDYLLPNEIEHYLRHPEDLSVA